MVRNTGKRHILAEDVIRHIFKDEITGEEALAGSAWARLDHQFPLGLLGVHGFG